MGPIPTINYLFTFFSLQLKYNLAWHKIPTYKSGKFKPIREQIMPVNSRHYCNA